MSIKLREFAQFMLAICYDIADPEGIAAAQKSMGMGQEDRDRSVRWRWSGKMPKKE